MDSSTKSAIKALVLTLRHTLEDELTLALKRYGIFTDQKWTPDAPPDRLTDAAEREAWRRIVTVIRRGTQEGRTLPQASADYVREAAFTLLNRLVGLKCLEVRGIIPEIITTRDIYSGRSQAHRDYRDAHPREARAADDALPAAIQDACRQVNADLIGYLFDPDDDYSLLWPRYAVLKDCIARINALEEIIWREDEIIGWLYQFYNAEEKVAVRRRGKPQTPHDVAVINQFFTPRWVVKFLVDNTLGRLWLEMHPDSARVRAKCDYLVPEVLADRQISESANQREGEAPTPNSQLDPTSPINNPAAPPRRAAKPVTDIRLLDPACGTMHFGHYACEVFAEMYRDSLDHGWPIQNPKSNIQNHEIPSLILQHNLFGVDIDRRAVQLAALSLFMKARTLHPEAQVRQVNLVSADATLPDSGVREQFLARYKDAPRVQKAFAQVLADMDHVAQVGSLLRVEERLRALLTEAGYALSETGELRPRPQRTIPGLEAPVRQLELGEQPNAGSGWTPGYTLAGLRDDLRAFARDALQEHDLNAQLFAAEADKAVRLLDVFIDDYDVVVMNPPYGAGLNEADSLLKQLYPNTYNDLYSMFVERGLSLTQKSKGYVGALTSRTFIRLTTFQKFREKILLSESILSIIRGRQTPAEGTCRKCQIQVHCATYAR